MERPERIVFLRALWFIMGGQPTLYRKTCNIFNLLALLLFFKMILFSCGRLVRSSCSPLVYFESVRSGRLVLLYYMLKLSSAKCHHFWSSHILSSRPHFFKMILFSCGRLVRSSCSPLVYFESVRSGRLVLLYYMLKLSSAKCHHFWSSHILSSRPHYINAHNKLQHAWHLLKELQR